MSWLRRPLLAAVLLCVAPAAARADEGESESPILKNASFEHWTDGRPDAWSITVGARRGSGPESLVRRGRGLQLTGEPATRVWMQASQHVTFLRSGWFRLRINGSAKDLRLDPDQFDNAHVSLTLLDEASKPLSRFVETADGPNWSGGEIVFRREERQAASISIFLSKTGRLSVSSLEFTRLEARDSLEVLEYQFARRYSYFDHKGQDPKVLSSAWRGTEDVETDESVFVPWLQKQLAPLQDTHIWIKRSTGEIVPTWTPDVPMNFDYATVMKSVESRKGIEKVAAVGTIGPDVGYVAIGTLQFDAATLAKILELVEGVLDRKGILLDLRANSGGDETKAQAIAAVFADQPRVYAKSKRRAGPQPTDFTEPVDRWVRPREGRRFTGPVVVLIGPSCVSSGEGFVKAMRVLPNVTLVGQPTRGASGNPQPVDLPNGVSVWFSRWVDMLPDGTIVEGKGVPPDVVVKHEGEGDPTFRAALDVLRKKIDAR